ncbi:MAG: 3'(2'),5'-bisphosphate nucleotidase CysQ, partial [Actinomycetota bacterium]|nr:3'(2'),5'-bisphosphate nucleotidase CysQ [Actinomycetota bacterium]
MTRHGDLERIESGLDAALKALAPFTPGEIATEFKAGSDPVTAADLAVDHALAELLPREGEGWLSEETVDDAA